MKKRVRKQLGRPPAGGGAAGRPFPKDAYAPSPKQPASQPGPWPQTDVEAKGLRRRKGA